MTSQVALPALLSFVGVVLLGALSPGPDFVVLTRRTTTSGRGSGLACAAGMSTGIFVWASAVVAGVAAVLTASVVAFTTVKILGAAYLVILGLRAWASVRSGSAWTTSEAATPRPAGQPFREGLLCNLLNPKVAVFYLALFPQFIPTDSGGLSKLLLAATAATTVLCWYLVVATIVASVRRLLASTRVRRVVDALTGTALIGLGLRIATT